MDRPLTPKQELFAAEYQKDLNATAAYKRAGYKARSDNAAAVEAHKLLRNPKIAALVRASKSAQVERLKVEADDVLRELLLLAKSDIGQVLDFSDETPQLKPANAITLEARRTISSMKVKRYWEGSGDDAREVEVTEFKLWDKLSALDKLARHLGLLKDVPTTPDGKAIVVKVLRGVSMDEL